MFLSFTGTSGYSSSDGSSVSQAQSYLPRVRASSSSLSAGSQPCSSVVLSVPMSFSSASALAILVDSVSARSLSSSR